MKYKKLLFAAIASLAATSSTGASPVSLDTVNRIAFFASSINSNQSLFASQLDFKLIDIADATTPLPSKQFDGFLTKLESRSHSTRSAIRAPYMLGFTEAAPAHGYRRPIEQLKSQRVLTAGFGNMNIGAVPETDTWLILLVGVGLVSYQLRRKHRSLQHSFGA